MQTDEGGAPGWAGRRSVWVLGAVVGIGAAAALWIAGSSGDDDRQAEVATRGARVMPFDLERTTHRFEARADGGVQTVIADVAGDSEQIDLIRRHLEAEAARFRAGDFDDPAQIHGEEMPGLAELKAGAKRIDIRYEDVRAGARISYRTDDAVLVEALHDWFEAQLTDHGPHAEPSAS